MLGKPQPSFFIDLIHVCLQQHDAHKADGILQAYIVLRQTTHSFARNFLIHAAILVDWDATLALHIKAYAYGIKHMALAVSQAEEKAINASKTPEQTEASAPQYAIVNMSSTVGVRGMPDIVRYATAKAGILGMTKQCAFDLGKHNIRCNTASPNIYQSMSKPSMLSCFKPLL